MKPFRRIAVALTLAVGLLVAQSNLFATTTTGINFRSTCPGYVTDAASDICATGADNYCTARGSLTCFGWVSGGPGDRDRDNTIDPELAGINFESTPTVGTYRIDLPATGSYDLRLAMGDAGSFEAGSVVVLFDNTTSFATIGPHDTNSQNFYDASNVLRNSAANWVSNNVSINHTFASTIFKFTLTSSTGNAVIAHIGFAASGGGGGAVVHLLPLIGVGK